MVHRLEVAKEQITTSRHVDATNGMLVGAAEMVDIRCDWAEYVLAGSEEPVGFFRLFIYRPLLATIFYTSANIRSLSDPVARYSSRWIYSFLFWSHYQPFAM